MSDPNDDKARDYNTALDSPGGSDPIPMGSNVSREDSADSDDAGEDTGASDMDQTDDLPNLNEPIPDDGLN